MIKSELIEWVAARYPHLFKRDAERAVNRIFDEIGDALARGDRVELRGFGSFSTKTHKARIGRNPRTGESVAVAEKRAPHFRAGKNLRARLNRDA